MVVPDSLTQWATELLRASVLPDARPLERVHLVEGGCICFTTRQPGSEKAVPRTALLRPSGQPAQAVIYRIVPGWPVLDIEPGRTVQGPPPASRPAAAPYDPPDPSLYAD